MAKRTQHNAWNEVYALLLSSAGTLLFFALISYVPRTSRPGFRSLIPLRPRTIPRRISSARLGAVVAGICYFLIGAASYLLAATLIGFGGAKLFHGDLKVSRRVGWIFLFIASGACLLNLQPWFLHDWRRVFKIQGPAAGSVIFSAATSFATQSGKDRSSFSPGFT